MRMFIMTVLVGFFGAGFVGNWLNWPDAGAAFAIAFVGAVLNSTLRDIYQRDSEETEEKD